MWFCNLKIYQRDDVVCAPLINKIINFIGKISPPNQVYKNENQWKNRVAPSLTNELMGFSSFLSSPHFHVFFFFNFFSFIHFEFPSSSTGSFVLSGNYHVVTSTPENKINFTNFSTFSIFLIWIRRWTNQLNECHSLPSRSCPLLHTSHHAIKITFSRLWRWQPANSHRNQFLFGQMIYAPFRRFSSFLCDIIRSTMKFIG